jgi:hypothetical protein
MRYGSITKWSLAIACAAVMSTNAIAVPISIDGTNSPTDPAATATGNDTSQTLIDAAIEPFIGTADELYKDEISAELGPLVGSYTTTYSPVPPAGEELDPSGAVITYDGGPSVGPTAWLLVKDGNAVPAWYLYNLTALGWTGTETITLTNFWLDPSNGAISHVALYGDTVNAREPGAAGLMLMGVGMLGMAGVRRRGRRGGTPPD